MWWACRRECLAGLLTLGTMPPTEQLSGVPTVSTAGPDSDKAPTPSYPKSPQPCWCMLLYCQYFLP